MLACRSCAGTALEPILSLGDLPLADGLLAPEDLTVPEPRYPLDLALCRICGLAQILNTVPPDELFGVDYPYFSSFSDTLLEHSRTNVERRIVERGLGRDNFVVELASNDGYLLQFYQQYGVPVLGIDPAPGPVTAAQAKGVPTLLAFFDRTLAARLRTEGKQADVIHANNVLAHVADTNGFVAGISLLLKNNGIAVIEVPYVRQLVEECQFDTIYHEHLCYFSVSALVPLFRRHGLFLNDVELLSIHGGSLRLFVEPRARPSARLGWFLTEEAAIGITEPAFYAEFATRVRWVAEGLQSLLCNLRAQGKRVMGYGAAAKGTIMLNYVGIGPDQLSCVVDRNIHKQGRYIPGVRLPIRDPRAILEEMPDYVLILPWNFKQEILAQQADYRARGGQFIIPIPEPMVIS